MVAALHPGPGNNASGPGARTAFHSAMHPTGLEPGQRPCARADASFRSELTGKFPAGFPRL